MACSEPSPVIEAVLADLLSETRETRFADEHGLSTVRDLSSWRDAVPIRPYQALEPYIDRELDGEEAVLTRSPPYAFLRTSGTSGKPKLVPTTRHWRVRYRGPALYAQWGLYFKLLGLTRLDEENVLDLSWERTAVTSTVRGYPVYGISQRPASVGSGDWTPSWYDAPWSVDETGQGDYFDRLYTKLRLLAGRDVRLVVSVNPSKIVSLAEHLGRSADRLMRDIHDGGLNGRAHPLAPASPELARRLHAAMRFGDGTLRLTDLWPRLSLLVCWNSASARLYRSWVERLVPDVPLIPFSATGTEGVVTLPVDTHPSSGPLAINQGIYEFVPWTADDGGAIPSDASTLDFAQLELGATYRLVMSQANGLYRYDVGDVYRPIGWVGRVPRLEFLGRAGFQSSFTGEKLTEADVVGAVHRSLGESWPDCPVFSCVPVWDTPPGYTIAMERTSAVAHLSAGRLADRVDRELSELNIEYAEKRRTGRLRPIRVTWLRHHAFGRVDQTRARQGTATAQLKHHWIQKDSALLDTLESLGQILPSPTGSVCLMAGA
ncbi:GH3 auxin-responsive promoter family protein [Actinoallomurus sp. NPDC052274]|uniref:GH3 auxin-responsive promoter family protein n=1 Tax=Actinoallomurus sp. NPDC052274 TaxID=3155420 RepID=UPI003418D88D